MDWKAALDVNWTGLLDTLSRVLAVVIVGGGALAVVFQRTLVEWFKSKFAHAVGKELETHKHQLARDLEAYKAAALREMEEFKLGIDIRRSIALKMADARLDAFSRLAVAFSHFVNEAGSMLQMNPAGRAANAQDWIKAATNVQGALRGANIFLPGDLSVEIASLNAEMMTAVGSHMAANTSLAQNDAGLTAMLAKWAQANKKLKAAIYVKPDVPDL